MNEDRQILWFFRKIPELEFTGTTASGKTKQGKDMCGEFCRYKGKTYSVTVEEVE